MVRCPGPMEVIHWQVSWIHGGNTWSGVLDPYGEVIHGQVS